MEEQVEPVVQPKKRLVLDTDWMSAAAMVSLLIICARSFSGALIFILRRNWRFESVTWHTWLLLGFALWCFITARERAVRVVFVLLLVGPVSRILLWAFKATPETQLRNAAFLSVLFLLFYAGGLVYVIWWFKSKIRHV